MKPVSRHRELVVAVHPWSRGMGWIVFEAPLAPVDWGICQAKTDKFARCMGKLEKLLERYPADTVVLETFEDTSDRRSKRIRRLCRALVHLAKSRGFETRLYSRAAIRLCFGSVGAMTRDEIVQTVAQQIEVLRRRAPPARKTYGSEDARLSLFEAAALALTHYAVTGNPRPSP